MKYLFNPGKLRWKTRLNIYQIFGGLTFCFFFFRSLCHPALSFGHDTILYSL